MLASNDTAPQPVVVAHTPIQAWKVWEKVWRRSLPLMAAEQKTLKLPVPETAVAPSVAQRDVACGNSARAASTRLEGSVCCVRRLACIAHCRPSKLTASHLGWFCAQASVQAPRLVVAVVLMVSPSISAPHSSTNCCTVPMTVPLDAGQGSPAGAVAATAATCLLSRYGSR